MLKGNKWSSPGCALLLIASGRRSPVTNAATFFPDIKERQQGSLTGTVLNNNVLFDSSETTQEVTSQFTENRPSVSSDAYKLDFHNQNFTIHHSKTDVMSFDNADPSGDPDFEEKLRQGKVAFQYMPRHLLQHNEEGVPILSKPKSRKLSSESAQIGTFYPLECNNVTWTTCGNMVSSIVPSGNEPLVINCGECFTFDIEGNVTFNGGIDIKGRLEFPVNHKATIHTKYVIVQGELDISVDHDMISPENEGVRFILTGTDDVIFNPTDAPNNDVCPNDQCDFGVKPFVIAGGSMNIQSMPQSCETHTRIKKKIYEDPIYDPNDFPQFQTFPQSCPLSGTRYISYDFEDELFGNWTGRLGTFMSFDHGALRVSNRKLTNRGPMIDITPLNPSSCLSTNQDYLFAARMKLETSNSTMQGESTTCKAEGNFCPRLQMYYHDVYDRSVTKTTLAQNIAPDYGEWFDLTGTITFADAEISVDNPYYAMYLEGPETDIDIILDSFDFFLPSESNYHDANGICSELVFNGDAESNGFNPYPFEADYWSERIIVIEENGNKFFRNLNRNAYWSTIRQELDVNCLTRGVTYHMSSKVRFHHEEGFLGGSVSYYWFINYQSEVDGGWNDRRVMECDAQSVDDGWVTCSGEFMIDEEFAGASEAWLKLRLDDSTNGDKYDLDFDDISISYSKGYVSEVVVDSNDVSCWGNDADVHVTSATYISYNSQKENGFVSQIASVSDNFDGTSNLQLSEASVLPIITEEENEDYAVEIALLSRNVIIEGDQDETDKGGYMQILHTPMNIQVIDGIDFVNMGRRSEVDRYPLQVLFSGELAETLISKNSFRGSHQRCISIEGSSNMTISNNVGWNTKGHCIYVGHQSQFNRIERNLVSDTDYIPYDQRIDGETDYNPAGFFNWYGPNDYIDNIAVATYRYGFQFENPYRARNEDGSEYDFYPRTIKMGLFRGNVAKATGDTGFRFAYHESNEEIFIENSKSIKNRYMGVYLYQSWNVTIIDCLLADNTQYGIQTVYDDNLNIIDTIIRGVTQETKSLVHPPYFEKPCTSWYFFPPVGYRMSTYINRWDTQWESSLNQGARLVNVEFTDFDHVDECAASVPIGFNTIQKKNEHFDFTSSFENVTFDGSKLMDAITSDMNGIGDIVITDVNGASNPQHFGQASQSGTFMSTKTFLTRFSSGSCTNYAEGITYCTDTCYRTVSFMVDQSDSIDYTLSVTRLSDGEEVLYSGNFEFDDNIHRSKFYDNMRFFSASLPLGSYEVAILKDLEPVWPQFVQPRWEGIPDCEGFASGSDINIIEPVAPCDELIQNGDIEEGTMYWQHRNDNADTIYGELLAVDGLGINDSTALKIQNRNSAWQGMGQNMDTRCLHTNLDKFYEIEGWVRLEKNNETFICDVFDNTWGGPVRCPAVTFRRQRYIGETLETTYTSENARLVLPNDAETFNRFHGVFKVDEIMNSVDRVFMYVENPESIVDMIIDDFSVKKLDGICDDNLVRNGDFESDSKFWWRYGSPRYTIENTSLRKSIKVSNRASTNDGIYQDFYINKDCDLFGEGERFAVTGKFKLEGADGPYNCDRAVHSGLLYCSDMYLWTGHDDGNIETHSAETVATISQVYNDWSLMAGILTLNAKEADHNRIYIRVRGPDPSMDVFYDEIQIQPLPKSCDNLIINNDFESGDSGFWKNSNKENLQVDITSPGAAGNSQFALLIQKYSWDRIYQSLDTRCFVEGQNFEITAKMKLVNTTDLESIVLCNPSELNVYNEEHCPSMTLRASECDVDSFEYRFWNTIDDLSTDENGFYSFSESFEVNNDLSSCGDIRLEIGRWIHEGRALVIDNVQVA